MRRFIAIFLLLLLPLQASWAGAAAYCQHETSDIAKGHFGHHEHAHKSDANQGAKKQLHSDCAVCHVIALQAVVSNTQALPGKPAAANPDSTPPPLPLLRPASTPYRPQWHRLA